MIEVKAQASQHGNIPSNDKRKRRRVVMVFLVLVCAVILALLITCTFGQRVSLGSRIVQAGDMTVDETQRMVDEAALANRITVSLAPALELDPDDSSVRVNFIVAQDNNGYAERFEIHQDDQLLYRSEVVPPGNKVERVKAPRIHPGVAIATVFAVDETGSDCGNPVSVEVTVE